MQKIQDHELNKVVDAFASIDQNELSAFIKESTIKKIFKTQSQYHSLSNPPFPNQ